MATEKNGLALILSSIFAMGMILCLNLFGLQITKDVISLTFATVALALVFIWGLFLFLLPEKDNERKN
jgi:hypothetical protein